MDIKLGRACLTLAPGEFVRVVNARGGIVRCLDGLLWVTQDLDTQDYLLQAGETLRIDGNGPTLIQAARLATFRVDEAPTADMAAVPAAGFLRRRRGLRVSA